MRICLNIIMKNEAAVLPRFLESVWPILDTYVIVDTGSTDNSKEIVKNFFDGKGINGQIFDHPFVNFEDARNFAIERAKELEGESGFGFFLDCKDCLILSKASNIKNQIKQYLVNHHRGSVTVDHGSITYDRSSFFRLSKPFYWKYPVHEALYCADQNIYEINISKKLISIRYNADGNSWTSQTQETKYKNYARMLVDYIDAGKGDSRCDFYTAQCYRDAFMYNEALLWYKKRLKQTEGNFEERYVSQLEIAQMKWNLSYTVDEIAEEFLECGKLDSLRAEHLYRLKSLYERNARPLKAIEIESVLKNYIGKYPHPARNLFLEPEAYKKQMKKLNVIWQTSRGDVTSFELEYIQKILLKNLDYECYFDCEIFKTIVDNALIIYSNDGTDISDEFKNYLNLFDEAGYTYSLLHLSNEKLNHNWLYYKKAKYVFRGYYDRSITLNTTNFIPIGFKSGFYNETGLVANLTRKYIWAFIGQLKNERTIMFDSLIDISPNFTHFTHSWNCPTSMTTQQVIEIYKQTIFIPCPNGWSDLDGGGFRLMEALEWGCIPIVKYGNNKDLYNIIYGDHPFVVVDSWEDASEAITKLINDPAALKLKIDTVQKWYVQFKEKLANKFLILKPNG